MAAVLGVAAVVCVSSAVAGEMLQDLKVGHILGGTPRTMQIGDFIGVALSPAWSCTSRCWCCTQATSRRAASASATRNCRRPQAGLMAMLARASWAATWRGRWWWSGICMGFALIMVQVKSPMLFSWACTCRWKRRSPSSCGGVIRWMTDTLRDKRGFNDAQKARVENAGVLMASGLIAGEAMTGLVVATFRFFEWPLPEIFKDPSILAGFGVLALLAFVMVRVPLSNAGRPEDPAPPTAIM